MPYTDQHITQVTLREATLFVSFLSAEGSEGFEGSQSMKRTIPAFLPASSILSVTAIPVLKVLKYVESQIVFCKVHWRSLWQTYRCVCVCGGGGHLLGIQRLIDSFLSLLTCGQTDMRRTNYYATRLWVCSPFSGLHSTCLAEFKGWI